MPVLHSALGTANFRELSPKLPRKQLELDFCAIEPYHSLLCHHICDRNSRKFYIVSSILTRSSAYLESKVISINNFVFIVNSSGFPATLIIISELELIEMTERTGIN